MNIIDQVDLSQTEQEVLAEMLSHPTVVKYFKGLGLSMLEELASTDDRIKESPEAYKSQGVFVQGAYSVVKQVLDLIVVK